jgi:hypothetical protein
METKQISELADLTSIAVEKNDVHSEVYKNYTLRDKIYTIRAIYKFGANRLTKNHEYLCNLTIDANDNIVIHEINENSKKQEYEFIDDELED